MTLTRRLFWMCALALFLFCSQRGVAQFVHAQGKTIADGQGRPLQLRGINLGNWMVPEGYMWQFKDGPQSPREIESLVTELLGPARAESFWRSYRDTYYSADDLHRIKLAGFNSIRVPIHYKLFDDEHAEGFRLLDRIVGWAKAEGLLVVIDLHAAPGGQTGSNIDDSYGYPWLYTDAGAQGEMVALWKRIAHHYRNETAVMGYDLLNEPLPHFPSLRPLDPLLEPLYRKVTAAIRTEDKRHAIILEGAKWDTDYSVFGPPFDANTIYEFHTYWTPPVQATIQKFLDFRESRNVPVWLGESGENTDEWVGQFARLLEKNDVGWAFWPYKKMDNTSSVVQFAQPEGWSEITAYARLDRGLGHIEDRLKKRPSAQVIDRAFAGLLHEIQFPQEKGNAGYVRALLPSTTLQ